MLISLFRIKRYQSSTTVQPQLATELNTIGQNKKPTERICGPRFLAVLTTLRLSASPREISSKCNGFGLGHLRLTSSGARDLKAALAQAGAVFCFTSSSCYILFVIMRESRTPYSEGHQ